MKTPLYRDSSKGMIFGVCAELEENSTSIRSSSDSCSSSFSSFTRNGGPRLLGLGRPHEGPGENRKSRGVRRKAGTRRRNRGRGSHRFGSAENRGSPEVPGVNIAVAVIQFLFFGFVAVALFFVSLRSSPHSEYPASGIVIDNQNVFGSARPFPFVRRLSRVSFALRAFVDRGFRRPSRKTDSERGRPSNRGARARRFDRCRSVRNV